MQVRWRNITINKIMKRRNKILIAVLIFFAIIIGASLIAQFIIRNSNQKNLNEGLNQVTQNQLATGNATHIKQITDQSMIQPAFSDDQKNVYFISPSSNSLFDYNFDTGKSFNMIPLLQFDPIVFATWSPDKKNVAITTQKIDESAKNWLINLDSKAQSALPDSYQNMIWRDNENIIAYDFTNGSNNKILNYNIATQQSADLIQFQEITQQYYIDLLSVSNNFLFYEISNEAATGTKSLYTIDLNSLQNNFVFDNLVQAKINDNSIILEQTNDNASKFFICDLHGQNKKELNVATTSIDSILKKDSNIYWVKSNDSSQFGNQGLSYSLMQAAELYNLDNGSNQEILNIVSEGNYASSQFFLANDQSKIFFINSSNNFLYSINLK